MVGKDGWIEIELPPQQAGLLQDMLTAMLFELVSLRQAGTLPPDQNVQNNLEIGVCESVLEQIDEQTPYLGPEA